VQTAPRPDAAGADRAPTHGPPPARQRAVTALVGLACLVAIVWLWHPARVALLALLLLPSIFPAAPVDPLALVTPQPAHTTASFAYAAGSVTATVFQPASGGPHGGVVLSLGAGPMPQASLGLRFAEALAREGVVVVVPQSTALLEERVLPEESEAFDKSEELLLGQPGVDPRRTGIVALSAAGGLAIVAAAQPPLRDRLRFVNALGGYYDARELLVDVGSRSLEQDGQVVAWRPEELTVQVLAIALAETLPDAGEQALVRREFVDGDVVDEEEWSGVSDQALAARSLLAGTAGGEPLTRAQARLLVERLGPAAQQRLLAISPSTYLGDVHAHLYLMHDTGDTFIPFTQSLALVAAAAPGEVVRATRFSIFEHVIPDRPVPWQTFLPELWALFWHVHAVLLELE
jgi:hypothetical protein